MYWFKRIAAILVLVGITSLLIDGEISVGDFCLLATVTLILVELSDINDKLNKSKSI